MRATSDEYWNTSLPKDHDALRELDAYCQEWGGLTRAEATRRLLIEWTLLRTGKGLSAWSSRGPAHVAASGASEGGARRTGGGGQKPHLLNTTAKAASQVLDD
jgi:hypothetical protein